MSEPTTDRKPILILGGSSYLGRSVFARLGPARASATFNQTDLPGGIRFDAARTNLPDVIDEPDRFSHALVLFGVTKPDRCAGDLKNSTFLNVTRTKAVIDQLRAWGIVPVFASSEAVFDGSRGGYVETDVPRPILAYGRQKLEIENYLRDTCPGAIVVRLARVFGSTAGDRTLLTEWLAALGRSKDIVCAHDQVFSPIHVDDAVEIILRLIQRGSEGVYHIANPRAYGRLEVLDLLLREYRRYQDYRGRIIPCSLHDFAVPERRPLDVSLDPGKVIGETGVTPGSVEEWCGVIARDLCVR